MPRPHCPHCHLPLARCYCDLVTPVSSGVDVVIWQHPSEANHPKGTAALLNSCLPTGQLLVAEQLSAAQFARLAGPSERDNWLLFPDTGPVPTAGVPSVTAEPLPAASGVRLLVLDGTWRKARKLLHLNPWLQQLPRLAVPAGLASQYSIRKAEQPHQLSTLEATCAAINLLERDPHKSEPLLQAFRRYIQRLAQQRPIYAPPG